MAQPARYVPQTDFSNEEAGSVAGRSSVRTPALDTEFDAIKATTDGILDNLLRLQRDDGEILDGQVKVHTLAAEVLALIANGAFVVRGDWLTATDYKVGDIVLEAANVYLCMTAHTSGVFATDLAAGNWGALTVAGTAVGTPFTPTGSLSSTNVQAAIAEVMADLASTADVAIGDALIGVKPTWFGTAPAINLHRWLEDDGVNLLNMVAAADRAAVLDGTTTVNHRDLVQESLTEALDKKLYVVKIAGEYRCEGAKLDIPGAGMTLKGVRNRYVDRVWNPDPAVSVLDIGAFGNLTFQSFAITHKTTSYNQGGYGIATDPSASMIENVRLLDMYLHEISSVGCGRFFGNRGWEARGCHIYRTGRGGIVIQNGEGASLIGNFGYESGDSMLSVGGGASIGAVVIGNRIFRAGIINGALPNNGSCAIDTGGQAFIVGKNTMIECYGGVWVKDDAEWELRSDTFGYANHALIAQNIVRRLWNLGGTSQQAGLRITGGSLVHLVQNDIDSTGTDGETTISSLSISDAHRIESTRNRFAGGPVNLLNGVLNGWRSVEDRFAATPVYIGVNASGSGYQVLAGNTGTSGIRRGNIEFIRPIIETPTPNFFKTTSTQNVGKITVESPRWDPRTMLEVVGVVASGHNAGASPVALTLRADTLTIETSAGKSGIDRDLPIGARLELVNLITGVRGDFCTLSSAAAKGDTSLAVTFATALVNTYPIRLFYDGQTANFTVGQVLTGGTSGATGTIRADQDDGTSGYLSLTDITGQFEEDEVITDPLGGAAFVQTLPQNQASGEHKGTTVIVLAEPTNGINAKRVLNNATGTVDKVEIRGLDETFNAKTLVQVDTGAVTETIYPDEPKDRVVVLEDDFLGDVLADQWGSAVGSDGQCVAPAVNTDAGGAVQMTFGDDAGATMALNGAQLVQQLQWRANLGGLVFEARVKIDDITLGNLFIGLTDSLALEAPFTLAAGVLTSNATDALGFLFDTAGSNPDNYKLVGVANDVDAATANENSGLAPVANTYRNFRIVITPAGAAEFYIDGNKVGTTMTAAVTPTVPLTPYVGGFSRTSVVRTVTADRVKVKQNR